MILVAMIFSIVHENSIMRSESVLFFNLEKYIYMSLSESAMT